MAFTDVRSGMFKEQNHLPELIRRTLFNLKFIEDRHADSGPFEVAQAINSCLAIVVHLSEAQMPSMATVVLSDVETTAKWPILRSSKTPPEVEPVSWVKQVECLRHGLAHGNVKFYGDHPGDVTHVEIWNSPPPTRLRTWGTKIAVSELVKMMQFIGERFGA